MDETVEGAGDYAELVSITLEIDGEVVGDQTQLQSVTEFPQARNCVRLGSTWRDRQTQEPLQCTHGVRWRYVHPPLAAGEHSWSFRTTYVDGEDGDDSFEEQYSGSFTTTRGIGFSR